MLLFLIFWLMALTALVIGVGFKRKKPAVRLLVISVVYLFLISNSMLSYLLVKKAERKYPVFTMNGGVASGQVPNIVVLGSVHVSDPDITANNQLSDAALNRLVEGIRIYRLFPQARLITSGYGFNNKESHARVLARTAISLGVPEKNILMMPTPTSTYEEAQTYRKNFDPKTPLILVTSALHMDRALYHFNKSGLHPIPAPTNQTLKIRPHSFFHFWKPSLSVMDANDKLFHELLGNLSAWWQWKGK